MFTDDDLKLMSAVVVSHDFPYGVNYDMLKALQEKCGEYLEQDPRKANAEIYGVISHTIHDHGEDLMTDDGIDFKVCDQLAEIIMKEIEIRFVLMDRANLEAEKDEEEQRRLEGEQMRKDHAEGFSTWENQEQEL